MIEVRSPGIAALVQDLGRPGHARDGVPSSGAADRGSHLRANALVGNTRGAATLELMPPGFACRFLSPVTCALTGAPAAATLNGEAIPHDTVFRAAAGDELTLGPASWGLRTYLAVRGGIDAPLVLGSRATDLLSGLGPPPLRGGDTMGLALDTDEQDWRAPAPAVRTPSPLSLPLLPAPGQAWVDLRRLAGADYTVSASSGRTALRLQGPPLDRLRNEEFPTQGLVRGAVQVPPDGLPIVFLADHPVTGGYPVIGVVPHTDRLAQLRPGQRLRLERA